MCRSLREHEQASHASARVAAWAMRRAEALGCKRIEMLLPELRSERHTFFENQGFREQRHESLGPAL